MIHEYFRDITQLESDAHILYTSISHLDISCTNLRYLLIVPLGVISFKILISDITWIRVSSTLIFIKIFYRTYLFKIM